MKNRGETLKRQTSHCGLHWPSLLHLLPHATKDGEVKAEFWASLCIFNAPGALLPLVKLLPSFECFQCWYTIQCCSKNPHGVCPWIGLSNATVWESRTGVQSWAALLPVLCALHCPWTVYCPWPCIFHQESKGSHPSRDYLEVAQEPAKVTLLCSLKAKQF